MPVASASPSHINQAAPSNVDPLNNRGGAERAPETRSAKPSIFQRAWSIAKDVAVVIAKGVVFVVAFPIIFTAILIIAFLSASGPNVPPMPAR